ncbi:V-type ATP synthase subunit I [Enterococcus lemanii]|jgi:V/A-type H+-transporting ATPase subunit I|uniref:V-type ATP synthase subunit I n=1 Tax=Enterococcus lemanii TaxID=1159752 RepID=A0ABV9MVM8_9ENTE|nr:V-type ATP synthase subunit I [Enterococcus lemanii]MBM7709616.1 V/A-type H+-transporting ATPase subunit I [Enterococcus lemanii]
MGVSRLSKMTLLAEKEFHEGLLKKLQSIQSVEIEDILEVEENAEWLTTYFPELDKPDLTNMNQYNLWLNQIRQGIIFVRNNGSAKQKIRELRRTTYSLQELEEKFDEQALVDTLNQLTALKTNWENLLKTQKYWNEAQIWATQWSQYDIDPSYKLTTVETLLAKVPAELWEEVRAFLINQEDIYFELNYTTEKEVRFSLALFKERLEKIQTQLVAFGVSFEQNPYGTNPKELFVQSKKELETIVEKIKHLTREIGYFKQRVVDLQLNEEILLAKIAREQVKEQLVYSKHLIVIRVWISTTEQEALVAALENEFNHSIYCSFDEPTRQQIETNQVPTKLKNNWFVAPFEILTAMYSVPKYEEIDPTPWMAPFYLVFFGMMVADLGYGALIFLATTFALRKLTLPKSTTKFVRLFQLLSISIMVWGIIYGSAFGLTLPFQLLAPTEDFMTIFALSVIFGGIQIYTGLFLAAKENIKKKQYLTAVSAGFSWQGILTGIFVAAAGSLVFDSSLLVTVGTALALFSAFLVIVIPMIQSKSKVGGFFSGLYELYGVTGYIGDFVSYSRLMALGISGGSIAMAFNMLVATMPAAAKYSVGILLIVALHALNIFLSLLGAYVHAARLQYVEFFGKFYEGGGRPFNTFKAAEKYINLDENMGGKKND